MTKLLKQDTLVCCCDIPLSSFNQNFFTKFYQPILSPLAYNFYLLLHSLIKPGLLESDKITIDKLSKKLNVKNLDDILSSRIELEALGLINTYIKAQDDNFYIIILNNLPTPFDFLNNPILDSMLKNKIDNESYDELVKEYIVHLYDVKQMKDITSSIDEAYVTTNNNLANSLWQKNISKIKIKDNHFDYEYVVLVLSSVTSLNDEFLKSKGFYDELNRLAWVFNLSDDELIEAIKQSIKDGEVDFEALRKNVKSVKKDEIKFDKIEIKEESNSQIVKVLNSVSPSKIVETKYHTKLTTSEMAMFDKLLLTTGISKGMLNALIIYVMESKNGEIPAYNYFLKIVNTWIRKGITTTTQAINEINSPKDNKTKKQVSDWYQEYQEEIDKKQKVDKKEKEDQESIESLEAFFNK